MILRISLVVIASMASLNSCWAQRYTTQGAVVGGATGAVIGGLIGKQSQKTTGGALIGGAVGAVAGGMMGRSYDNQQTRQHQAHQQALHNQQQQFYAQQQAVVQSGVTTTDVLSMTRSGLAESVIIAQINARGMQRRLEVNDIISLHQQGVSDTVLTAMQTAPLAGQSTTAPGYAHPTPTHRGTVIHEQPVIYSNSPRPHPVYQRHYRW
ncbi:MAG: glycine zipper 2TM domain-containing protein [Pirellulaceae bacterium]|nr:glycine zipper 2TM domain-containing protein [Pirellulaceae bacterium]